MKICVAYVSSSTKKNEILVCPYSHTENRDEHYCGSSAGSPDSKFYLIDPLLIEFIKNNATPELNTETWSIIELDD